MAGQGRGCLVGIRRVREGVLVIRRIGGVSFIGIVISLRRPFA
jgi:hypothetical protein